jgi:myxalamid-type polyketide synthase MxaC
VQGDVSRPAALAEIFSKFGRTWPPLRGLVHSAGLLDDGLLLQQTRERFEKVLAPKAGGAWLLHALTRGMDLDFFIMFSSAVSLLGSAGQSNHVAACAFEDGLAHHRRALGLPALSIDWGPWAEIGAAVRHQVTRRLETKGFRALEPLQGLRIFEHLLELDLTQAGVLSVDWRQYIEALPPGYRPALLSELDRPPIVSSQAGPSGTPPQIPLERQLSQAPPNKRRGIMLAHVRELAMKVLGFGPSFKLDPQQGLTALGMDSLMTIELKNRLQASLGKTLSSTLVFDHPTIAALAEYLEKVVLGFSDDPERPTGTADEVKKAEAWEDLEPLLEAEAAALLDKELSGSK